MKFRSILNIFLFAPLCLCAACGDEKKDDEPKAPETHLKIMSFNTRYLAAADLGDNAWDMRRQPCINMYLDEMPDLVGTQEMRPQQREELMAGIGDYYGIYGASEEEGVDDAVCGHTDILYRKDRFEILDKGFFWQSLTPDKPSRPGWGATDTAYRTTCWVFVRDKQSGKEFYFYNTHLPYKTEDNAARTAIVKMNIDHMKSKAGLKGMVFITGDMNASTVTNDSRRNSIIAYNEWMFDARDYAKDLTPGVYTYNEYGQKTPGTTWNIDHIYYRHVTPLEFKVVNSPNYGVTYISDHYPIVLTCKY